MFKNALKIRKMTTRDLCILAMFIAITAVLSYVSGILKTPVGKLNVSFISVYVCAALFGPVAGGILGAMADLFSVLFTGGGAPIVLFTVIEFINGFLFGLLFYKAPDAKERSVGKMIVLAAVCVILQYIFNMLRIPVLAEFMGQTWLQNFIVRIPTTTAMLVIKFVAILLLEPHMIKFQKVVMKK